MIRNFQLTIDYDNSYKKEDAEMLSLVTMVVETLNEVVYLTLPHNVYVRKLQDLILSHQR